MITNYHVQSEPLTAAEQVLIPSAQGQQVLLPNSFSAVRNFIAEPFTLFAYQEVGLHSINTVLSSLDRELGYQ